MANRNFTSQFTFSLSAMPVRISGKVLFGASGAPTLFSSSGGIANIVRLKQGVFRIQLQDNYPNLIGMSMMMSAPMNGSTQSGGAFSIGAMREIVTLGTTTQAQWVDAGVPAGIAAAPGVVFFTASAGAGTGTVQGIATSNIASIELIGYSPQTMLTLVPSAPRLGGYITIQTMGAFDSTHTQLIDTDPAEGSGMFIEIDLNNSSVP